MSKANKVKHKERQTLSPRGDRGDVTTKWDLDPGTEGGAEGETGIVTY